LAALLYELLFGRRVTGVGSRAVESIADVPGADVDRLRAAFARALAGDADDRFPSALDFAQALKNAFPDELLAATARPAAADRAATRVSPPPVAPERAGAGTMPPPVPPPGRAGT